MQTGIDLDKLVGIGAWISGVLGREYGSKAGKAIAAKKAK
jgi:hydroxymethylglutaryl-CoA lyase